MRRAATWTGIALCALAAAGASPALESTAEAAPATRAAPAEASGSGSCAFVVRWRGRTYEAIGVEVSPRVGRPLGRGVSPSCNDTGGSAGEPERIRLAALPGVRPRRAVAARGRNDVVLVRRSLVRLPAEVKRLLNAPRCTSDGRVRLIGSWLGILGGDGRTETDLVPPYVLQMHVRHASRRATCARS